MAVLGFTTTSSVLKDQVEAVKAKGIEAFGVSVVDDTGGKHDVIGASNAQLHLFMQMKRGNVTHMMFQSSEQADIFLDNMVSYYGEEKAGRIISSVKIIAAGDSAESLRRRNLDVSSQVDSFEAGVSSLV